MATGVGEVEAYLDALVEFGTPPGLSLVVVKGGEIVYGKGFGLANGPNGIPATSETVYKWWSMTKVPTAIAVLQLHEQGKLNIDDPVVNYVPSFEVECPSESCEVVTIRHLLNHSSGLPNNMPEVVGWMHLEDEPRLDQTTFLEEVFPRYAKLKFEPGSRAAYTNVGYMVLGAIVEAVSGQTYEDYVVEHIARPLGMEHTNFFYTSEMLPYAAVGSHPILSLESALLPFFYDDLDAYIREKADGRIWFNRFYADSDPPTGLIGPATDAARLMTAYLNGGELDGAQLLLPETVEMMTYDRYVESTGQEGMVQGLGWHVFPAGERLYLQHDGGGPAFGTAMRLYPEEGLGIVVMANDTTYDRDAILDLVASLDW
jgi:CubicO group peptidase (beta-lactamase class C family)